MLKNLLQGGFTCLDLYLREDSEFLPLNFLHEFFGHGLFCEYSLIGMEIVSLENQLAEIEKEILGVRELPENFHFQIDESSPYFQRYKQQREQLVQFFNQNLSNYEGFAMWMESHLAELTDNYLLFERKMDTAVPPGYRNLFEQIKSFEDKYGKYALVYRLKFPKYYNQNIIKEIVDKILPNQDLVILYGSQKPYADIDLFVVGDKRFNWFNGWLDIYSVDRNEFDKLVRMFDISVTDLIFTGTKISGKYELSELQKQILSQPITQEAIKYNFEESERQKQYSQGKLLNIQTSGGPYYSLDEREKVIAKNYATTYRINAEELQRGNKILTLENIREKYGLKLVK